MKTLALTMAMLCMGIYIAAAQDTLLLMNGEDLYAKVENIDGGTISYTIPPDATVFTLNKDEVYMIKYADGTRQTIGKTQTKEESIRAEEERDRKVQAKSDYERYRDIYLRKRKIGITQLSMGGGVAAAGIALLVVGLHMDNTSAYGSEFGTNLSLAGSIIIPASAPFLIFGTIQLCLMPKYKRKMKQAKQQLSFAPVTQPLPPVGNIGGSYSGVAMRFNF